ncbi:hypothetical protein FEM48_Zijuj10G0119800 [Ziziphus jujuba var. spinosa]|uniref:Terpene synthase metal-binding domain-containing protein n=1 Tax=Ziziphus jujuba var. spinosa TaxID=714518 RepID=A0A978UN90_ZIZJJ|nr:hypothetical protein FEM48_Zijuj10G0119800 [Ziziphus jujuba var. spinosa]
MLLGYRWDIDAMHQLPAYLKIVSLLVHNSVNEIAFDVLKEQGLHIIQYLRKADELKRDDVPKSIQCYMHETGALEADVRKHIKFLIGETRKNMNEDVNANGSKPRVLSELQ